MTTIRAEAFLKMIAWQPGRLVMGEMFPEIEAWSLFGVCETSQQEWRTVWPRNSIYTFSTSAENLYVSSSSALDVGRIIQIDGLDAQFNRLVGYGITNGQNQSIVTSLPGAGIPLEFYRVNYMSDITPSLTFPNASAGNIYVAALTTPVGGVPPIVDTRDMIKQGFGRRESFVFTVPAGYALMSQWAFLSHLGEQQVSLQLTADFSLFSNGTLLYLPRTITEFASLVPGSTDLLADPCPFVAAGGADITVQALGTSPTSGTVTIQASGALINYKYIKNLSLGGRPFPIS